MHLTDCTIRLTDLLQPGTAHLAEVTAERVTFHGPAVLLPQGAWFEGCKFNTEGGGIESILWELDPARTDAIGGVVLDGCSFKACSFHGLGVAGTSETLDLFLKTISV